MTETIEQLIDDVIGKTIMFHGNKFFESKLPGMYARYREEMDYARFALLSRITQIQQEADTLQAENSRMREALKLIRMVAGNRENPESDKSVIRGIVDDTLKGGEE